MRFRLIENLNDTIKLYTLQNKRVLDTLKSNNTYYADIDKAHFKYKEQYQNLSKLCGFSNAPIFCVDKDNLRLIEASNLKTDDNHIIIKLNVPIDKAVKTDYYGWSDYLYWSSSEDDKEFKMTMDQSLKNIDKYVTINPTDDFESQYIIDRIKPEWLV